MNCVARTLLSANADRAYPERWKRVCAPSARRLQLAQRLGNGIVGDCIHQSNFERASGGAFFCGDEKLQRSAFPDQAWQALHTSPSGHEAESGAAMSEDGVGSGDPSVTGERKIKTSSHAVAFDRGNDGGGITGD